MTATAREPGRRPSRVELWDRFGAPQEQVGSVNDPRTQQEHGVTWNEKWIYRDRQGRPVRLVLWERYDLVGIFRVTEDGGVEPEPLE